MADSDRRELTDDMGVAMRANNDALQSVIWTALPGFIVDYDPSAMTCSVQPTIQAQIVTAAGVTKWVTLPLLVDCPVQFPMGGGFALTFPLKANDECLVIFSSRCIDSWWHSSGIQVQAELRMHDLSDGFVIPGVRSLPKVLTNVSTTDVQLRNDDGTVFIGIKGDSTEIDAIAPTIRLTGNVIVTGNLSVSGIAGGAAGGSALRVNDLATPLLPSYKVHNHGGVSTGHGYSDIPFPGS